jgi:hypothetical protein
MIITYRNKTHINLKLCTFSMKNPHKISTVITNIRGSLLYQRQSGLGGGRHYVEVKPVHQPVCLPASKNSLLQPFQLWGISALQLGSFFHHVFSSPTLVLYLGMYVATTLTSTIELKVIKHKNLPVMSQKRFWLHVQNLPLALTVHLVPHVRFSNGSSKKCIKL